MIVSRRKLIGMGAAGAGGLLLSGCDRLNESETFKGILNGATGLNQRTHRLLMGDGLAREFTEAEMSPVFKANGSIKVLDPVYRGHLAQSFAGWALQVDGLVKQPLNLPLAADPRFATNRDRMAHSVILANLMNEVLRTNTRAAWQAAFDAAGVPSGPVHTVAEALSHPQTLARGMVVELDHPQAGPTRAIGCPIHFSETPTQIKRPAPLLGQHTRELLVESGYSVAEIDSLFAQGVVQ